MKIGIISDTHNDLYNLETALDMLRGEGVMTILHCGDVCGPEMVRSLEGFDVWIAQGNMDRQLGLAQVVEGTLGHGRLAWFQRPSLDGYALAMIHGDNEEVLANLIHSGQHRYIFHGHTHRRSDRTVGRTRAINPGALGGRRWQTRSFCILDMATGEARFVEI